MSLLSSKEDKFRFILAFAMSMVVFSVINFIFPPQLVQKVDTNQQNSESAIEDSLNFKNKSPRERYNVAKSKNNVTLRNDCLSIDIDVDDNRIVKVSLQNNKEKDGFAHLIKDGQFIENGLLINDKFQRSKWKVLHATQTEVTLQTTVDDSIIIAQTYRLNGYVINMINKITNKSKKSVNVMNYSRIYKNAIDYTKNHYSYHGVILNNGSGISELEYKKIKKSNTIKNDLEVAGKNWVGFSEQYYFLGLVPKSPEYKECNSRFIKKNDAFQIDISSEDITLASQEAHSTELITIATPKEIEILDKYKKLQNIDSFDKVMDFGIFYFLSKPMLLLLYKLNSIAMDYHLFYTFGLAIIALTIIVRVMILPLAYKSYKSMAIMKDLAPEIQQIQERYKDDKTTLHKTMLEIYKKNNVSPFASIVPLLLQIPIFFAIYKVIIICPGLRSADFLWIKDLSLRESVSIFNLFGLIPIKLPEFLQIGALPVIMGITMHLQSKLNPVQNISMDKTQENIMKFVPVIFTFMFASFPAGLVLYWSVSNIFTILQQTILMFIFHRNRAKK